MHCWKQICLPGGDGSGGEMENLSSTRLLDSVDYRIFSSKRIRKG
jgi:hypothetical protein